uniref:Uncharacterized protein n=1 Tax=Hyaloperonospora arabidopsidis (strain Emoy2) TaxID=559515 RepID=M4BJ45_HYAAE
MESNLTSARDTFQAAGVIVHLFRQSLILRVQGSFPELPVLWCLRSTLSSRGYLALITGDFALDE